MFAKNDRDEFEFKRHHLDRTLLCIFFFGYEFRAIDDNCRQIIAKEK